MKCLSSQSNTKFWLNDTSSDTKGDRSRVIVGYLTLDEISTLLQTKTFSKTSSWMLSRRQLRHTVIIWKSSVSGGGPPTQVQTWPWSNALGNNVLCVDQRQAYKGYQYFLNLHT